MKKTYKNHENRVIIPGGFILAGLIFVAVGIYQGEVAIVLRKAIHICLECIGIG